MTFVRADFSPPPQKGFERRIHIVQGEFNVSSDPDVMLTTLLGSCVAACLRDPVACIGGMNHFLLPGQESGEVSPRGDGEPYAFHLMELHRGKGEGRGHYATFFTSVSRC